MTKDEKAFLADLVGTGCALCRMIGHPGTPAEVHHLRTGTGTGRRASHWQTIPLCYEHHRGATGFHGMGKDAFERLYRISEVELMHYARRMLKQCLTLEGRMVRYCLPGSEVEPA